MGVRFRDCQQGHPRHTSMVDGVNFSPKRTNHSSTLGGCML